MTMAMAATANSDVNRFMIFGPLYLDVSPKGDTPYWARIFQIGPVPSLETDPPYVIQIDPSVNKIQKIAILGIINKRRKLGRSDTWQSK